MPASNSPPKGGGGMVGLWGAPSAWQSSCPAARDLLHADSRLHLLWVGSDALTGALLTLREEGGGGGEQCPHHLSLPAALPLCVKSVLPSLKWDQVLMHGQSAASAATCELLAATPAPERWWHCSHSLCTDTTCFSQEKPACDALRTDFLVCR